MNPIYLDLHIHTSDDPDNLNLNYDLDKLISKVKEKAQGNDFLISFTDHNTINEKVYLEAIKKIKNNLILGVELHIQTHKEIETNAYHCHVYFNLDEKGISLEVIKDINEKLDILFPNKVVTLKDKDIPDIQQIIESFDEYDFILLPHGGQTHSTFDEAMPKNKEFDNAMQRSIYYNFFDGFTSRSDKKTEKTKEYLEKLGVHEFVNLITCTDNYDPNVYPSPKNTETYKFIPTWMFATPTFGGLRLSLSDSSRLEFNNEKPNKWRESIKNIKLKSTKIDIDINLTPGLNVIIGESSSGKTLLVDSLYRKITKSSFDDSKYKEYDVDLLEVNYPEGLEPHFIEQNFIISVTREDKNISDIEIIKKILPENFEARKIIDKGLIDLKEYLNSLFFAVEQIEILEAEIKRIPILSSLIISEGVNENILKRFVNTIDSIENINYSNFEKIEDLEFLEKINQKLNNNPFIKHNNKIVQELKSEIEEMRDYSILESDTKEIITNKKNYLDEYLQEKEGESQRKKQDFDLLINKLKKYYVHLQNFEQSLKKITNYSIEAKSNQIEIEGYVLSVENKFELNNKILEDELNNLLLKDKEIKKIDNILPKDLFRDNFKSNLKGSQKGSGATYKLIKDNIHQDFVENDKINYKIKTPDNRDFDKLSPGLKTSIILELILNFKGDNAPLVIDQPEDNLATSYMNDGLVKSIKKMKSSKQIIFVSHNATIPMSGDAQNIILCENNEGKIEIRSSPLEGKIKDINMVDYIARIADGGKSSIKKRFKKYNLKKFK